MNNIDLNNEINESPLLKDLIEMVSKYINKKRYITQILDWNAYLQFSFYPYQEPPSLYVQFKKSPPWETKFIKQIIIIYLIRFTETL